MDNVKAIDVRLEGIRPMLFDRYAGDNKTKLPPQDKFYLDSKGGIVIPSINILSLLTSKERRDSVRKYGGGSMQQAKQRNCIADAIMAFVDIQPLDIPLLGADNKPLVWKGKWSGQFSTYDSIGRPNNVPNPQTRPMVSLPWALEFRCEYEENPNCSLQNFRDSITTGGYIGIGGYRPVFGRYRMVKFDVK